MKKYTILFIVSACACVIGGSTAVMLAPAQPEAPSPYYLADSQGKVVLYERQSRKPVAQYNIYTRLLPPSDTEALAHGIAVHSPEELNIILEDLGL